MNSNILNEKSLRDAPSAIQALLIISAAAMVGLSIYLTNHYFQVHFPTDLSGSSALCNISSFFTCDKATLSGASNILGVPISLIGIFTGLFLFTPYLFGAKKVEGFNFYLLLVNGIGCLALFFYSLIALGTLCPMCTLFYIASWAALFCYWKYSTIRNFDFVTAGSYSLIVLIAFGTTYASVNEKFQQKAEVAQQMVEQYDRMPVLGNPDIESPFILAQATENFEDAPIQLVVFSDYQCPACRVKADIVHDIIDRYPGKINAQYYFYPLDHDCNPFMQRPMNQLSCQGAYLTACLSRDDFIQVHDDIFDNQDTLSLDWIRNYAQRKGVLECLEQKQTRDQVVELVLASEKFRVQSTPTILINGVKVEGVFPLHALAPIFDALIERAK